LCNLWLIRKQYKVEGYILRAKDIYFQQGFFWTKKMIIPFNRIQHASVHQGPLERYFNIGKLRIFTAGGQSSDLTIPGLSMEDAIRLKQLIGDKTGTQKRNTNE
jgi:membrane protein YdbS with pleckstrin-like domain